MVAATGNQGLRTKGDFPTRDPETIGGTCVSQDGSISRFSNLGSGLDIAAPGDRISSAWINNSKKEMSGTSMAVPHVVGTVALILKLKPHLNPEQIRFILIHSAVEKNNNISVLNAEKAVKMLDRI